MLDVKATNYSATKSQLDVAKKFSSVVIIGPTLNDKLIKLIAHLFTPEEAEVARLLPFVIPISYKAIALRARRPMDEIKGMLEKMNEKRVIFRLGDKYSIIPLMPGVFEYIFFKARDDEWTREFARLLDDLIDSGYFRRYTRFKSRLPSIHYVPVNSPVDNKSRIVDDDFMAKAIAHHDDIAIINICQCRQHHVFLGKGCKYGGTPQDGCLWFGKFARWACEDGCARKATKDEARKHLAQGKEKNLVCMTINASPESDLMVCLCCECCCHILRVVNDFGGRNIIAEPQYLVSVDHSLCNNCGTCKKICHTSAHLMENKTHSFNIKNCIGCGVCVESCKKNAIRMIPNPKYTPPPKSFVRLLMSLAPKAIISTIMTTTYEKILRR